MTSRFRQSRDSRRGVATVEFALTVPVLLLLVVGAIEFSRANMLLHSAAVAASEGARRGIIAGSTADEVETIVRKELATIGVKQSRIAVHPQVVTNDTKLVAVAVRVPVNAANGYILPRFFLGKEVTKVMAMPREAKNDPQMTSQLVTAMGDAAAALASAPLEEIGKSGPSPGEEGGEPGDDDTGEGGGNQGGGGGSGGKTIIDWIKKIFGRG